MRMSGTELLIYGLMIAGFLLFNWLSRQAGKRAGEVEEATAQELPAAPAEEAVLENIWGRAPAAASPMPEPEAISPPVQRTDAPVTAPPRSRIPASAGRWFRTRQDLRQAIVVMTVLGPCRALEPPGDPWKRPSTNGGRSR